MHLFNPSKNEYSKLRNITSWITLIGYLIGSYYAMQWYYFSLYRNYMSYTEVILKILMPLNTIVLVLLNLFYITLHFFEIPYFEQFKINGLTWPWTENPTLFKRVLPEAIKTYIINFISFGIYSNIFALFVQPSLDHKSLPNIPVM